MASRASALALAALLATTYHYPKIMRSFHPLAVAGLLNILALTTLLIGNVGWLYERSHSELSTPKYWTDAPLELRRLLPRDVDAAAIAYDDGDRTQRTPEPYPAALVLQPASGVDPQLPSYLYWAESQNVSPPQDWAFQMPKFCNTTSIFRYNHSLHSQQKIIVHYHMQHNAGTEFYHFARQFTPCATRACWQCSKHCMVSNKEEVEAENIRNNYRRHGVQYVSYELMLPPRFPLPFVSEDARRGLFFTTIMRDPFKVSGAYRSMFHSSMSTI